MAVQRMRLNCCLRAHLQVSFGRCAAANFRCCTVCTDIWRALSMGNVWNWTTAAPPRLAWHNCAHSPTPSSRPDDPPFHPTRAIISKSAQFHFYQAFIQSRKTSKCLKNVPTPYHRRRQAITAWTTPELMSWVGTALYIALYSFTNYAAYRTRI